MKKVGGNHDPLRLDPKGDAGEGKSMGRGKRFRNLAVGGEKRSGAGRGMRVSLLTKQD